jgi:hypothetical protein
MCKIHSSAHVYCMLFFASIGFGLCVLSLGAPIAGLLWLCCWLWTATKQDVGSIETPKKRWRPAIPRAIRRNQQLCERRRLKQATRHIARYVRRVGAEHGPYAAWLCHPSVGSKLDRICDAGMMFVAARLLFGLLQRATAQPTPMGTATLLIVLNVLRLAYIASPGRAALLARMRLARLTILNFVQSLLFGILCSIHGDSNAAVSKAVQTPRAVVSRRGCQQQKRREENVRNN